MGEALQKQNLEQQPTQRKSKKEVDTTLDIDVEEMLKILQVEQQAEKEITIDVDEIQILLEQIDSTSADDKNAQQAYKGYEVIYNEIVSQYTEVIQDAQREIAEQNGQTIRINRKDLESLQRYGVITEAQAQRLERINTQIQKINQNNKGSNTPLTEEDQAKKRELYEKKDLLLEQFEVSKKVAKIKNDIEKEKQRIISRILKTNIEKVEELEEELWRMEEAFPDFAEITRDIRNSSYQESQQEKKEIEEHIDGVIRDLLRFSDSLATKHAQSFNFIGKTVEKEDIVKELLASEQKSDKKEFLQKIKQVRNDLSTALYRQSFDEVIAAVETILPWERKSKNISYEDAMGYLKTEIPKNNKNQLSYKGSIVLTLEDAIDRGYRAVKAEKLLKAYHQILRENKVLSAIAGKRYIPIENSEDAKGKKTFLLGGLYKALDNAKAKKEIDVLRKAGVRGERYSVLRKIHDTKGDSDFRVQKQGYVLLEDGKINNEPVYAVHAETSNIRKTTGTVVYNEKTLPRDIQMAMKKAEEGKQKKPEAQNKPKKPYGYNRGGGNKGLRDGLKELQPNKAKKPSDPKKQ